MDFSKTLEALKDGKNVRRSHMNKGYYIFFNLDKEFTAPYNESLFILVKGDISCWKEYQFGTSDIFADDWEILDESTPEDQLTKYKEWLYENITKFEEQIKTSSSEGNHQTAASFNVMKISYEACLKKLNELVNGD